METDKIIIFEKLISNEKSNWLEKAKWREENEPWLDHSALIAIKILRTIKEQNINQKILAERLNVSPQQVNKIIKGSENLSLETIAKLEKALGVKLIEVVNITDSFKSKITETIATETKKS